MKKLTLPALVLALVATPVFGATVDFATNGFEGTYQVSGHASTDGDSSLNLAAGSYNIVSGHNTFQFDVDAAGNVSTTDSTALTVSNGLVSFNTSNIVIDANGFDGKLRSTANPGNFHRPISDGTEVTVIKGGRWSFDNGYTGFTFDVDGSGNTTTLHPDSVATTGTDNVLSFQTAQVQIETNGYEGILQGNMLPTLNTDFSDATETLTVIKGQRWALGNGAVGIGFDVDPSGNVSVIPGNEGSLAVTAPDTLAFQTSTITVQPNGYEGQLRGSMTPNGGFINVDQPTDLVVINDMLWGMNNGAGGLQFTIDENGQLSDNSDSVSTSGSTLTLDTTVIDVTANGFTGRLRGGMTPGGGFITFDEFTQMTLINDMLWGLNNATDGFLFYTDEFGEISSLAPDSMVGNGTEMIFETIDIEVDPLGYTGNYRLPNMSAFSQQGVTEHTIMRDLINILQIDFNVGVQFSFLDDLSPILVDVHVDALGNTTPFEIRVTATGVPVPSLLPLFAFACLLIGLRSHGGARRGA